ncbi:MAG: CRP-like cAMP-binding protein [Flavobacteriales bacterium]|jgi:CRP-like cAMP-binding protein
MDGLACNTHTNSAIALETSAICEIPFSRLEELSTQIPTLQRRFFQLMSKEIADEQQLIILLGKTVQKNVLQRYYSAYQRVTTIVAYHLKTFTYLCLARILVTF